MPSPGRIPIGVVAAAGVAAAGLVAVAAWQLGERDPDGPGAGERLERPTRAAAHARPADALVDPRSVPREVVRRMARQLEVRRASVCGVLRVDAGDELLVDGAPVEVPADGTVVVRAPDGERRRSVPVVLRLAGGGEVRRELSCRGAEGGDEELEMSWERR